MRISDWSSDVCSSDLAAGNLGDIGFIALSSAQDGELIETISELVVEDIIQAPENDLVFLFAGVIDGRNGCSIDGNRGFNSIYAHFFDRRRSAVRRVGKACVSTCSSRWCP